MTNSELQIGQRVKVKMHNGIMVGQISFQRTIDDGRSFVYVVPERVVVDGEFIFPKNFFKNGTEALCIPLYAGLVQAIRG